MDSKDLNNSRFDIEDKTVELLDSKGKVDTSRISKKRYTFPIKMLCTTVRYHRVDIPLNNQIVSQSRKETDNGFITIAETSGGTVVVVLANEIHGRYANFFTTTFIYLLLQSRDGGARISPRSVLLRARYIFRRGKDTRVRYIFSRLLYHY